MSSTRFADAIQPLRQALDAHPVYAAIGHIGDLQCFMEHPVYSVWDCMSLIKYLQSVVAPTFHYYLKRHIHLDEDFHAPLSLRLLEELCAGDPVRIEEAIAAARQAIEARIAFWDGVLAAIASRPAAAARAHAPR